MNKRRSATIILLSAFFLVSVITAAPVQAQNDNSYFIANQMLQRQEYQRAYELFHELHKQNPSNYIFFEKTTESLINLKEYDKAIDITSNAVQQPYFSARAGIRLGEIYHIRGDTEKAYNIWDRIKKENPDNMELYLAMARAMRDRRAFEKAITTYREAAKLFSDATVLSNELANTYMQAGEYEKSIREYLKIIEENPDRISYVQSTLLRFDDEYIYDIAILEIGDFLRDLPQSHPGYRDLHQLEVWLLLERELYDRALATARNYEESQSQTTYSLYGLGAKLLSERQYELAEKAYRYYVDNNIGNAKNQGLEEIASVYTEWADYLENYNLSSVQKREELYRKAFQTLERLQREAPNYRNLERILISQSELALDRLHDVERARKFLTELEQQADSSNLAQRKYIEGRINLYEKNYDRARIAFTKSNKQDNIGEMAEKTRYFLALTDFFAGDYEFAQIQLNALERQSTSYFANDAVQLRVWIQDGLQADSTGKLLEPFARAVELFSLGDNSLAIEELKSLLLQNKFHPLTDEALLELSSHVTPQSVSSTYEMITHFLDENGRFSPLRERLMWEKARIAEQVTSDKNLSFAQNQPSNNPSSNKPETVADNNSVFPKNIGQVITLYEDILLEFPQGFYATFARSRIQELQNIET